MQEGLGDGVTLLGDPTGKIAAAYGVLDRRGDGEPPLARAATFFVDAEGRVRKCWFPTSYRLRPDPEELLAALR